MNVRQGPVGGAIICTRIGVIPNAPPKRAIPRNWAGGVLGDDGVIHEGQKTEADRAQAA